MITFFILYGVQKPQNRLRGTKPYMIVELHSRQDKSGIKSLGFTGSMAIPRPYDMELHVGKWLRATTFYRTNCTV